MNINNYEVEVLVSDLSRQLEDLSYRLFRIEDEIANLKAYMEDQAEENQMASLDGYSINERITLTRQELFKELTQLREAYRDLSKSVELLSDKINKAPKKAVKKPKKVNAAVQSR